MEDYYLKKLSWTDVSKLRGSTGSQSSVGWKIIEKLMMFDYRAVYAAFEDPNQITTSINKEGKSLLSGKRENNKISINLHPMDIMNAIYNCCDYIVLQTLMEKLFACRLSIPLLLPDPRTGTSKFLLWSLRGIIVEKSRKDHDEFREISIADMPQVFVSFSRIGRLRISKSELLNDLLKLENDTVVTTFFHCNCDYGMTPRLDSNGTVEASWYIPNKNDEEAHKPAFTVLNLRGDVSEYYGKAGWLWNSSEINFLFVNFEALHDTNFRDILKENSSILTKFILCVIADPSQRTEKNQRELDTYMESNTIKILDICSNWNRERLLSDGEFKSEIRRVLNQQILSKTHNCTNLNFVADITRIYDIAVDEDDSLIKQAYSEMKHITDSVSSIDFKERKLQTLPLQGDSWKKFGRLRKEQYRNIPDQGIEAFIARKGGEQAATREEQFNLLKDGTSTFIYAVISQLRNYDQTLKTQYWLTCLQFKLNTWSRLTMPALQVQYEHCLTKFRSQRSLATESDIKRYKLELDESKYRLDTVSFRLEHIFREFGQIYESIQCQNPSGLVSIYEKCPSLVELPSIVASLMLQGIPFELMDGDAAFVPVTWVKSVFEAIEDQVGNKKLFIISVIGVQSSGKSTLLNTMFGLKFAVSAGRCTMGIFCQLIPVDRESMNIDYDYFLVIDTEGLRAIEIQEATVNQDSEIATLVFGMSDATIVNVEGENLTVMEEILDIVIHALIRIKCVHLNELNPSCIFVHQHVCASGANKQLTSQREKFLLELDAITASAVKKEGVSGIKHFRDLIYFEEQAFAHYMQNLWQGEPPMARVNNSFYHGIEQIKKDLIKIAASNKNPITISQFGTRITDLWEAILHENFVSSFRNSEEVYAKSELDEQFKAICDQFHGLCWTLRNKIQSELLSIAETHELQSLKSNVDSRILIEISNFNKSWQAKLDLYFDNHKNKAILEQWWESYSMNLKNECDNGRNKLTKDIRTNINMKTQTMICEIIICEIKLMAQKLRDSCVNLDNNELEMIFETEWPNWLHQFDLRYCKEFVLKTFEEQLLLDFDAGNVRSILESEIKKKTLHELKHFHFNQYKIVISMQDLEYVIETTKPAPRDSELFLTTIKSLCNHAVNEIQSYVESCIGLVEFDPNQASHVSRKLKDFLNKTCAQTRGQTFTYMYETEFMVRFVLDVCRCAINVFIGDSVEVVCAGFKQQLFECFPSQASLMREELSRNSLYDLDRFSLDEYFPTSVDLISNIELLSSSNRRGAFHQEKNMVIVQWKLIFEKMKKTYKRFRYRRRFPNVRSYFCYPKSTEFL